MELVFKMTPLCCWRMMEAAALEQQKTALTLRSMIFSKSAMV